MKLPSRTKLLRWLGYPAFYVICLLAFAYATFPYDRLKQRLIAGYNATQVGKPEPRRMEVGDLTWSWRFPGVVLTDVELIAPKPEEGSASSEETPPKQSPVIAVDEVYATASLWSMLLGRTSVDFQAVGFNGKLSGSFAASDDELSVNVEFDGVDPGQLPGVAEALQLPLSGTLNGTLSLVVPEKHYSKANGQVELSIDELEIGDGKTKIRGLLALPTVRAGTLAISAQIKDGKATIERFEANGPDLEVHSDGRIRLRDELGQSLVEQMNLSFNFSAQYRTKDKTTESLLGKPGERFGGAIELDPQVKRARQPDGSFNWRIAGPLANLRFTPGRATSSARRAPRSTAKH